MNHDWIQEAAREIVEEYPIYGENAVAEVAAIISRLSGTEQSETIERCAKVNDDLAKSLYSFGEKMTRLGMKTGGYLTEQADALEEAAKRIRALSPTSDANKESK